MTPTSTKDAPNSLHEDDRATLPDINLDDDNASPQRGAARVEEDIGAVQRPPADSLVVAKFSAPPPADSPRDRGAEPVGGGAFAFAPVAGPLYETGATVRTAPSPVDK